MKSLNKYIHDNTTPLYWLCGWCVILFSCVEVSVEERSNQAYLIIHPDESEYILPDGLMYHFYNADQPDSPPLQLQGGERGRFEGGIPAGSYRVIATNLNATGVMFEQMDNPDEAIVRANSLSTRVPDLNYLEQPGLVYSVAMGQFTVTHNRDTLYYYPKPALLTKKLTLRFNLQEELQEKVDAMEGVLPGVYPAVHLFNFQPSGVSESPSMAVNFQTAPSVRSNADTRSNMATNIFLFGICNPEYGSAYRNVLYLVLKMKDQTTTEVEIELTNALSDIIEENEGEIPVEVPVEIDITQTPIGAQGEVVPWKSAGENDTTLKTTKH